MAMLVNFPTPTRHAPGKYTLSRPLMVVLYGHFYSTPADYIGGPTVPWWLRWVVPPERIRRSGYLHDALIDTIGHPKLIHDAVFYTAAKEELERESPELPRWRRQQIATCAYLGVRIAALLKLNPKHFEDPPA